MDEHASRIASMRAEKDHWMRHGGDSPIGDRASFAGLRYYEIDPALRFARARLVRHPEPKTIVMQTSDGAAREYRNVGHFDVSIGGTPVRLQAYASRGDRALFVPFRDKTSGKETYGAGRYLDLHPVAAGDSSGEGPLSPGNERGDALGPAATSDGDAGDVYDLDLNLAYNPMCAYSEAYSCPFPPPENWLQVPIRAGEKTFE